MKRFLVTTADERTWRVDRPTLFLGEWCRLYERKHLWGQMDAIVASPFGLGSDKKHKNREFVQQLTSQLLVELTDSLNLLHGTRHDSRYWQIVVGHWLRRYVGVLFNRYHALETALAENEIDATVVLSSPDSQLATNDSMALVWSIADPFWNHVLYSKILRFIGFERLEFVSEPSSGERPEEPPGMPVALTQRMRRRLQSVVLALLQTLSRKTDAFIVNSYLPLFEELCLQISLGQVPQVWRSPQPAQACFDGSFRLGWVIDESKHDGFELFVRLQLREMMPVCYLEGYGALLDQINKLPWPTEPRFIFTSNNFEFDEVCKLWIGAMVEKGVPYITGQHGNNYGTYAGLQDLPELVTCDRFLTWGWMDNNLKNVPAFAFTISGRAPRPKPSKSRQRLLLVEHVVPPRQEPEDTYFLFDEYQQDQFKFVEALPERIQESVTVRLAKGHERFSWNDQRRWRDRSTKAHIDLGDVSFEKLTAESRLIAYSYDSTGLLESLALNIPTICFWREGFDHLLPEARTYYDLLRKVGIFMETPEQAAKMVAEHWDNIEKWWGDHERQSARKSFCNQYARTVKNPIATLKRLLTGEGPLTAMSSRSD